MGNAREVIDPAEISELRATGLQSWAAAMPDLLPHHAGHRDRPGNAGRYVADALGTPYGTCHQLGPGTVRLARPQVEVTAELLSPQPEVAQPAATAIGGGYQSRCR